MGEAVEKRNGARIVERGRRIHFIGVGGVGMYSLARLAIEGGASVSGSDRANGRLLEDLASRGAFVYSGSDIGAITDVDEVVYSLAVAEDDAELKFARESEKIVLSRAEYLGKIMQGYREKIGVCGSHGKSTVSAMVSHILSAVGKDPTSSIGAPLGDGLPFRAGGREMLVFEACEYRDSFLKLYPDTVCATNLELDHTDYFKDLDAMKRSFLMFMNRAEERVILNEDDADLSSLIPLIDPEIVRVGTSTTARYRYLPNDFSNDGITYSFFKDNILKGRFRLPLIGDFNLTNAALAIATAAELGVSVEECGSSLESFRGIGRRMEKIGAVGKSDIIYDYAHHPTEIRAVIDALRLKYGSVCVIFKPHTYTRTRDLWWDFVSALSLADVALITDIYAAREAPIDGITAERLAEAIGEGAAAVPDREAARIALGYGFGAIAIMGAGDNSAVLRAIFPKSLDNRQKMM